MARPPRFVGGRRLRAVRAVGHRRQRACARDTDGRRPAAGARPAAARASRPAALEGVRAARRERAARRQVRAATAAGRGCRAAPSWRPASAGCRSAGACTDGAAASRTSSTGPCSTSRPAYSTPIVSANWATRPMSWPISTTAACEPCCSRPSVCMTWRWTTTSRALVGSSATMILGWSAVAMAIAARCLWPPLSSCGIAVGHVGRQADLRQRRGDPLGDARRAAVRPRGPGCRRRSGRPTRMTGLSEFIAACGTSAISRMRMLAQLALVGLQKIAARRGDPARRRCAPGDGAGARCAVPSVVLPEPDSPINPIRSPARSVNDTPSTALTGPAGVS